MNRRALAIVCGGNQLLFAAQVKHTLFADIPMDMAYLDIDISEEAAGQLFDGVYKIRSNVAPPKSKALRCFVFPKYAIKKFYAEIEPGDYTDLFFYGPTWLYYFLYKYSVYSRHKYDWHLLPEGAGAYLVTNPQFPLKDYGNRLVYRWLQIIDKLIFGYSKKNSELIRDVYLIHPECSLTDNSVPKISVPAFDRDEVKYMSIINSMLKYERTVIDHKVIIIDGALDRSRKDFYDMEKMDELIVKIGNRVGKEKVLLKRKHGVGFDQYSERIKQNVSFFTNEDMPWELLCINGDIKDCVIISVPSSAIVLPYVFCGFDLTTYRIKDKCIPFYFPHEIFIKSEQFYDRVVGQVDNYRYIENLEDVDEILEYGICTGLF